MCVHAAGESSPGNLPSDTYVIVLAVPSELALLAVAEKLAQAQVAHVTIHEPDAPWSGALMAIGLRPARREVLRRHVAQLPLLK